MDDYNITLDAHNVNSDNFSQASNTQRENENAILKREKLDKLDALAETLKGLTINDAIYDESDSSNANDAKGDTASEPKIVTHTSDRKKRKFTDNSNGDSQQKLLSNRTLTIITMAMDPQIDNNIATFSQTPHTIVTHLTKEVITDAAHRSAQVLQTPRHVIRTGRGGTNPENTPHDLSPPWDNSPVLIEGIGVSPTSGHSDILQVFN